MLVKTLSRSAESEEHTATTAYHLVDKGGVTYANTLEYTGAALYILLSFSNTESAMLCKEQGCRRQG
jgi:hypothetical protein